MIHDPESQAIFDAEDKIMQIAHTDIAKYPPVSLFPPDQAARMLRDYEKFLVQTIGLTRTEVDLMVMNDLQKTTQALRALLINLSHIGPVRSAVLLHVALFIGAEPMLKMTDMISALRKSDYDGAYRALMLSAWPGLVGNTREDRIRVLNLADQLRSGQAAASYLSGNH